MNRKRPEDRSHRWLGVNDSAFVRSPLAAAPVRLRCRRLGRPAGHRHHQHLERDQRLSRALASRAENVKRGVLQAGGFPIELPAMSLAEPFVKPSTMLYRNFLAMEAEELLRSHPIDGAVLLGGCDKTTPGLVMGAISMGIPHLRAGGPDAARQLARRISRLRLRRGNTGRRNAQATSPRRNGVRWRADRAPSAPAW